MKFLNRLFSSKAKEENKKAPASSVDPLQMNNEIQSLRMDLEAAQAQSGRLKQEIDRLRSQQAEILELTLTARLEALFTEMSGPASQILTQAELVEKQGKPVQIADVLSIAKRMVRAMERNGLVIVAKPGDQVLFDPNKHTPINQNLVEIGQPVTVRFAGMSYGGKMIYKAIVE